MKPGWKVFEKMIRFNVTYIHCTKSSVVGEYYWWGDRELVRGRWICCRYSRNAVFPVTGAKIVYNDHKSFSEENCRDCMVLARRAIRLVNRAGGVLSSEGNWVKCH